MSGHRPLPLARGGVELIPGLLAVVAFVYWAVADGGYGASSWGPGGLFLLGLLVVTAIALRDRLRTIRRAQLVAIASLSGFVVWSFASIAWAGVPGISWDGTNLALIYLITYAIFSIPTWSPRSAAVVIGAYAFALVVVGLVVLSATIAADAPDAALIFGRLAEPTGYPNAVAALFVGGGWAALLLSSRPEVPWPLRASFLAFAGILVQVALLTQSRGAILVAPLAVLLYVAVVPGRLRGLVSIVALAVATTLAAPAILDVYTQSRADGDVGAALAEARTAILISGLALLVVGAGVGLVDRAVRWPAESRLTSRKTGLAVAGVVVAIAVVTAVAVLGNPVGWAGDRWQDFKGGYDSRGFGDSRFSGDLGSNRYDFWRVAVEEGFDSAPLTGIGADNFAVDYIQNGRSDEEPLYPHSLPIRVLSGTGLIGAGLLTAALISALLAVRRGGWRNGGALGRSIAAAGFVAAAYLLMHSAGDWLWSFAGLTAPAFAWLAMAARIDDDAAREGASADRDPGAERGPMGRLRGSIVIVTSTLAIVAALASLLLPWAATRDVELAAAGWRADPEAAFDRLERARALNFLSAEPDLVAGAIAVKRDDRELVRRSFTRALEREPENWYAHLQLGAVEALEGNMDAALEQFHRARELNPRSELPPLAIRRARGGKPLSLGAIEAALLAKVCDVIGTTDATEFCRD